MTTIALEKAQLREKGLMINRQEKNSELYQQLGQKWIESQKIQDAIDAKLANESKTVDEKVILSMIGNSNHIKDVGKHITELESQIKQLEIQVKQLKSQKQKDMESMVVNTISDNKTFNESLLHDIDVQYNHFKLPDPDYVLSRAVVDSFRKSPCGCFIFVQQPVKYQYYNYDDERDHELHTSFTTEGIIMHKCKYHQNLSSDYLLKLYVKTVYNEDYSEQHFWNEKGFRWNDSRDISIPKEIKNLDSYSTEVRRRWYRKTNDEVLFKPHVDHPIRVIDTTIY